MRERFTREHIRFVADTAVEVTVEGSGELQTLWVENISAGGVFVSTPHPPQRGTRVQVKVATPLGIIPLQAVVVHCIDEPSGRAMGLPVGAGLQFVDLTQEVRDAMERYVRGLAKAAQPSATGHSILPAEPPVPAPAPAKAASVPAPLDLDALLSKPLPTVAAAPAPAAPAPAAPAPAAPAPPLLSPVPPVPPPAAPPELEPMLEPVLQPVALEPGPSVPVLEPVTAVDASAPVLEPVATAASAEAAPAPSGADAHPVAARPGSVLDTLPDVPEHAHQAMDVARRLMSHADGGRLYEAVELPPNATAEEISMRLHALIRFLETPPPDATPPQQARLQTAAKAAHRIQNLFMEPARRLDFDFRNGILRPEERLKEAAQGLGPAVEALRAAWMNLHPTKLDEAANFARQALEAQTQRDFAKAVKLGTQALELDPFNAELRNALSMWAKLAGLPSKGPGGGSGPSSTSNPTVPPTPAAH